jgi:hypothetical protein
LPPYSSTVIFVIGPCGVFEVSPESPYVPIFSHRTLVSSVPLHSELPPPPMTSMTYKCDCSCFLVDRRKTSPPSLIITQNLRLFFKKIPEMGQSTGTKRTRTEH